jgi:hypothetical protein
MRPIQALLCDAGSWMGNGPPDGTVGVGGGSRWTWDRTAVRFLLTVRACWRPFTRAWMDGLACLAATLGPLQPHVYFPHSVDRGLSTKTPKTKPVFVLHSHTTPFSVLGLQRVFGGRASPRFRPRRCWTGRWGPRWGGRARRAPPGRPACLKHHATCDGQGRGERLAAWLPVGRRGIGNTQQPSPERN